MPARQELTRLEDHIVHVMLNIQYSLTLSPGYMKEQESHHRLKLSHSQARYLKASLQDLSYNLAVQFSKILRITLQVMLVIFIVFGQWQITAMGMVNHELASPSTCKNQSVQ